MPLYLHVGVNTANPADIACWAADGTLITVVDIVFSPTCTCAAGLKEAGSG